jgi:hypothetical protein
MHWKVLHHIPYSTELLSHVQPPLESVKVPQFYIKDVKVMIVQWFQKLWESAVEVIHGQMC